jgi:hypothetical protein
MPDPVLLFPMRTRLGWTVIAVAVLAFAAGACSKPSGEGVATAGGDTGQNQTDPNKPADEPAERVRQFVTCMRAEGIDLPDPEPGDATGKSALRYAYEDKDKNEIGPAMEKCSKYLPAGGDNVRLTPEQIERSRLFARCMRENGVPNFPDPDPEGNFSTDAGIDKTDPAMRDAIDKCRNSQEGK